MKDFKNLDPFLTKLRHEYTFGKLDETDLAKDPFEQFARWIEQALKKRVLHLDAMALATSSRKGKPSVRMVLLKGFDKRGFVFYTHYDSHKGRDLKTNPQAEVVFFWGSLEKQVRITGKIQKLTTQESDRYFATRPRESQIGCWASHQSDPIASRQMLEKACQQIEKKFQGQNIPRPPFWGGYRLKPEAFEFWQGRANRLNDRFFYKKTTGGWARTRLQP